MREANDDDELEKMFVAARTEAANAFGNDEVYLEKLIRRPRHVEIQIIADTHGNAMHLCERDCSIQRRHQKLIEEAPCPVIDEETRQAMGEAALKAVRGVGYVNAGTIEFLLDTDGSFYFMEMNTRLQVEHPVTYDSLMAKLIVWGDTREEAIARGKRALDEFVIEGVATTIPFHRRVLDNATFNSGMVYTDFIETETNGGQL